FFHILFNALFYFFWFNKLNLFCNNSFIAHQTSILKKNNYHIFICQKWLLSLRYQDIEEDVSEKQFQKTLKSIKYNLTKKEYRWLKAEIDNFVRKERYYIICS
ncbi:MAG: hypothetical protein AAFY21_22755, partial [Cyanobacteria bacterium J06641_2]